LPHTVFNSNKINRQFTLSSAELVEKEILVRFARLIFNQARSAYFAKLNAFSVAQRYKKIVKSSINKILNKFIFQDLKLPSVNIQLSNYK